MYDILLDSNIFLNNDENILQRCLLVFGFCTLYHSLAYYFIKKQRLLKQENTIRSIWKSFYLQLTKIVFLFLWLFLYWCFHNNCHLQGFRSKYWSQCGLKNLGVLGNKKWSVRELIPSLWKILLYWIKYILPNHTNKQKWVWISVHLFWKSQKQNTRDKKKNFKYLYILE